MGDCCSRTQIPKFHPSFDSHLTQLYDQYLFLALYLKQEQLFAQRNRRLEVLVQKYLKLWEEERFNLTLDENQLRVIDMVHKLHPLDYGTSIVTKQWLIAACLRQHKFISDIQTEDLKFDLCFTSYVQFLYLCFICEGEVIVPTKIADFMWHAHMQDHDGYTQDMEKMMGRVLDHVDDFSEGELRRHQERTDEIRLKLSKFIEKNAIVMSKYPTGEGEDGVALYGTCAIAARALCGTGQSGIVLPSLMWMHGGANCGATCGIGRGGTCGGVCGGAHCGS